MKKSVISTVCLSLLVAIAALPSHARPLSSQPENLYNKEGVTVRRGGVAVGPNRDAAVGRRSAIQTDGQGNATYQRSGRAVGPEGDRAVWTTNGNASYDPEEGYSGEATTTVNDQTYQRNTSNGSTTVTNPEGESTTYTRRRYR